MMNGETAESMDAQFVPPEYCPRCYSQKSRCWWRQMHTGEVICAKCRWRIDRPRDRRRPKRYARIEVERKVRKVKRKQQPRDTVVTHQLSVRMRKDALARLRMYCMKAELGLGRGVSELIVDVLDEDGNLKEGIK